MIRPRELWMLINNDADLFQANEGILFLKFTTNLGSMAVHHSSRALQLEEQKRDRE